MHVLLTGAAGGIGAALARAFDREGVGRFGLCDIATDAAGALAKDIRAPSVVLGWDLAQPGTLDEAWAGYVAEHGPVDLLINCAGVMDVRTFAATPWADGARLLDVDLVSPLRLMALALPSMVARGRGGVINISSMAGITPLRGCAYYCAAKAGLGFASEIARLELAPRHVKVLTVYPGPVATPLERRARAQLDTSLIARLMPTGDAETLADRVVTAWRRDEARVVYPPLYDLASRVPALAGLITRRLSPAPRA